MKEKCTNMKLTMNELKNLEFALNEIEKIIKRIKRRDLQLQDYKKLAVIPFETLTMHLSATRFIINEVLEEKV